jgi:hypothetical protein
MDITSINEDELLAQHEQKLQRATAATLEGQKANSREKLLGLLLKQACGAESPKGRGDNLATIDGAPTRFHAADGMGFTFNEKVEPPVLVFLSYKGKPTADKPLLGMVYGLRLANCLRVGKKVKGNGTERISVSLASVKREPLGVAMFPAQWTEAESVPHRLELEDGIEKLTAQELATMISAKTREKIRAFVLAGREEPAPATVSVLSPPVEGVAPAADQEPAEPEVAQAVESATGGPEVAPVTETASAESTAAPSAQQPPELAREGGAGRSTNGSAV